MVTDSCVCVCAGCSKRPYGGKVGLRPLGRLGLTQSSCVVPAPRPSSRRSVPKCCDPKQQRLKARSCKSQYLSTSLLFGGMQDPDRTEMPWEPPSFVKTKAGQVSAALGGCLKTLCPALLQESISLPPVSKISPNQSFHSTSGAGAPISSDKNREHSTPPTSSTQPPQQTCTHSYIRIEAPRTKRCARTKTAAAEPDSTTRATLSGRMVFPCARARERERERETDLSGIVSGKRAEEDAAQLHTLRAEGLIQCPWHTHPLEPG